MLNERVGGTEAVSNYKTFCNLCQRVLRQGEPCYSYQGSDPRTGKAKPKLFMVHLDCNDEEVRTRMTLTEFRKNAKVRSTGNKRPSLEGRRRNW